MKNEVALIPSTEELNVYQVMAKTAGQSQLFQKIGGEAGLLSIMLMARELGLPPLQSLMGGMNIIQGKVEISPRLMNSMIRKAGHKIEIVESTDQKCTLKGTRHDTKDSYSCSFTIDDARRAGLVRSGGGYERWASDMLFARCLSRLARRLFADVISTAYIEGEISSPIEELTEMPQKSTIEVKDVSDLVETVDKPKEMDVDEFIAKLREKVGEKYDLIGMQEYLPQLEAEKHVSVQKIMQQALNPALVERFCKGWQKWYISRTPEDWQQPIEELDKS